MSNDKRGLRAAISGNIIELPTAKAPPENQKNELRSQLGAARKRRDTTQDSTNECDTALATLQGRYAVLAEPPAIWDKRLKKLLKEQGFKLLHRTPKMRQPGGDKKRAIAEVFLDHVDTTRCSSLTFRPGRPQIDGDFLNLWTPAGIREVEGDVSPFIDHLVYVFDGDQQSIDFVLNWMGLPLQKPGTKMETAILLVGKQGTGKTTLGDICRRCHGIDNSAKIKGDDLLKDFNEYMMRATVVIVEEVYLKGRWDLMDRIKDTITSTKIRINIKHVSPYEISNVANFMLFSNHSNALALPDDDRRWHVHVSHQPPKDNAYYERLYNWLEEEDGYEKIYHFLMHRDLSDFSRHTKPPMTRSKAAMAFGSKSDVEQRISDDIEDRVGLFACDLVTLDAVFKTYAAESWRHPTPAEISAIKNAMHRLAANTGRRLRVKFKKEAFHNAPETIVESNVRVWAVRNPQKWMEATSDEMRLELKKGYPHIILEENGDVPGTGAVPQGVDKVSV